MIKRKRRSGPSGAHVSGVQIGLRAESQEQKSRWQAAAERDRRTLSDWIRCALDDAAAKRKQPAGTEPTG